MILIIYTLVLYKRLPQHVPIHYDVTGSADNYSHKWILLIITVLMLIIWLILYLSTRFYENMVEFMQYDYSKNEIYRTKLVLSILNLEISIYIMVQGVNQLTEIVYHYYINPFIINILSIVVVVMTLIIVCIKEFMNRKK
ncbi:DUF1648 domain-containing protein [Staphylococcus simiae]|nr:DUF1648 domain-containing protein [Staphylococcus simiae]QSY53978.1 DUF1648 domain-containing protein [Staphylococcus simiae]